MSSLRKNGNGLRPPAKRSTPRLQVKLTNMNSGSSLMPSSITSISAKSLEKVIELSDNIEESTENMSALTTNLLEKVSKPSIPTTTDHSLTKRSR